MADITGQRGTLNVAQGIRKTEVDPEIYSLDADAAPLTVLLNRAPKLPTNNPEFKWFEDDREDRFDAVNGTTGTGTDIVVDTPALFAEHQVWKNTRTAELMRVQSVNAGTSTVTFVRGIGASAVATADNDELMQIGWAQPEGDTSRPARSTNPTSQTNYTQIIRTPYEATRTWNQSATFTRPSDWTHQARKAMVEHMIDWEETFWHGKPSENTSGSQPRRTTGGFFHYVTTNVTAMGGTMTETEFWGVMSAAFRYGNRSSKVLFASRLVTEVLNTYPRGKLEVVQADGDTTYGVSVNTFRSPFGDLKVVTHNLLEGSTFGGYFAIVDLSKVRKRPLVDSEYGSADTHVRENIQENDRDGRKDEILTEAGFQVSNNLAHAYATGITG
jgi:hypothetical protein